MIIIKEAKEKQFTYDLKDLLNRAKEMYKKQRQQKMHNYSEEDALPQNLEAIIKEV